MIDKLNQEIEKVNANIELLPKSNKKNIEKYNEYIDECIQKFKPIFESCEAEIKKRYDYTLAKYKDLTFNLNPITIEYSTLKLSDVRVTSSEKLNLDYMFFKLENLSEGNLNDANAIFLQIVGLFKACGINLSEKDFQYSENVNVFMRALLNNDQNIQDTFNNIYWQTPDIIKQIELNIKHIYYKNESKLNEFFKTKYAGFDFAAFISNHRNKVYSNELLKHKSIKYIYDLFINKTLDIDDFIIESRIQDLISILLVDPSSPRNYENLLKLKKSLNEYKGYIKFEYIIDDFKELFKKKEEYKGLFSNKLKDINKKEKELFSLNKKINNTGLFKLNKVKLADTKLKRNNIIGELVKDYSELDDLKIKECISKYITNETNYYDILKFTSYNFNYFVKLLEGQNEELSLENIDAHMLELNKYIYDSSCEIINNIVIAEEKNIPKIISEMYKLNSIIVDENKLTKEQIDKFIEIVDKLLIYYDVYTLMMNLKEIKYLIQAPEALNKY